MEVLTTTSLYGRLPMAAPILPPPDPALLAKAVVAAEASQWTSDPKARRDYERQAFHLWIAAHDVERRLKRGRTQ
jgi:hypothetical protein